VRVSLAYGERDLSVEVPDESVVVEPAVTPPLPDEPGAVRSAVRAPLAGPPLDRLVAGAERVAVVFPDITRPMPNTTVLPPLLDELERAGAGPERVELLCATGTHRSATDDELRDLVGEAVVDRYRIHQHRSDDTDAHVAVGTVDGVPILLDRRYVEADRRILTGFVEPHFFAGWSGGPKGACPGLAATATILEAHSPTRIADPRATWLTLEGNPVHEFVRAATDRCPPDLSVDVTIDGAKRLTGVFAGPLPVGHRAAVAAASRTVTRRVSGRFDVVLTTNGGHPLDRNLYQSVKGLAAAERVVAQGGIVVMASACGDGVPEAGAFARILHRATDVESLARPDGPGEVDRWQAQVLGRVLRRAEVWLYAEGLSDGSVRSARMVPVHDVATAVGDALAVRSRALGRPARLCVLPRGPLTVATAS
jgi:nickel-dependent lactate racemase